jgi:F0F1-type ATP synthase epsilon subunit
LIKSQVEKKYYVEEGTVEFSNNNLLILTSTAKNLDNLDKRSVGDLLKETEKKLQNNSLTDKEKYILSYKMSSLKEINQ